VKILDKTKDVDPPVESQLKPYRMRLPGFTSGEEVGLGDVIKRATSAIGLQPCGGCERRAAAWNRWLSISGRRSE
jgi:hypothetical protein